MNAIDFITTTQITVNKQSRTSKDFNVYHLCKRTLSIVASFILKINFKSGETMKEQTFSVDPETITVPIWFMARL